MNDEQIEQGQPEQQQEQEQPAYEQPPAQDYRQPSQTPSVQQSQQLPPQPIQYARPGATSVVYGGQPQPLIRGVPQQSFRGVPQQPIRGESRVEYYPIERRVMEYETVERTITEQVPQQKIEYVPVERKIVEQIPKEKVYTDYQAVEYQREYVPRVVYDQVQEQVPVTKIEYVPVQKIEYVPQEKVEYVTQTRPVERVEYDEIEYQVQVPQVQQVPPPPQVQQNLQQSIHQSVTSQRPPVVQPLQQSFSPVPPQIISSNAGSRVVTRPLIQSQAPQLYSSFAAPVTRSPVRINRNVLPPQQVVPKPQVQQKAQSKGILDNLLGE